MPKLSVLMPVYNAEKFLPEAMDSVLRQTLEDFEFIIIDDGSTDSSVAIIQSYSDPRIRLYRNESNLGITATLNKGIELAETDLIARMDADDISYPERLQKQFDYMQAHPDCAMVSALARVISETGRFIRQDRFGSDHFYYNLTFICWIYHPTVMYRRKAVREVGMYSETFAEDYDLFWKISRRYKFYNLAEVLLDYRVTGQSLHQVRRKKEYELAQQQQVLRNIRFYTGSDYQLPPAIIECFRHNFEPLLAAGDRRLLVKSIRELDYITQRILEKENINRQAKAIRLAAWYKRSYIIRETTKHLPYPKRMLLILKLSTAESIVRTIKHFLVHKILHFNTLPLRRSKNKVPGF